MFYLLCWTNNSEGKRFDVVKSPETGLYEQRGRLHYYKTQFPNYRRIHTYFDASEAVEAMNKLNSNEMCIVEIEREIYGGCGKLSRARDAINRHSVRHYVDNNGQHWILNRTVDAEPMFFELYNDADSRFTPRILERFNIPFSNSKSWITAEKKLVEFLNWLDNGGWDEIEKAS